jgi:hypothetical protein
MHQLQIVGDWDQAFALDQLTILHAELSQSYLTKLIGSTLAKKTRMVPGLLQLGRRSWPPSKTEPSQSTDHDNLSKVPASNITRAYIIIVYGEDQIDYRQHN